MERLSERQEPKVSFRKKLNDFLRGFASVYDFPGVLHPRLSDFRNRSDADAIRSAWEAVGQNLQRAMMQTDRELGLPEKRARAINKSAQK